MKKTATLNINSKDALIITDVQIDFLPGGALAVKAGDQIIPVINDYIKLFKKVNAKIVASRDWHPQNHMSFKAQGGPWPPHCVQESEGALFHPNLKLSDDVIVVSKATDFDKEAYSVFDGTDLADRLASANVTRVFVGGLATDYCILSSVLDAVKLGFDTVVLVDAIRGINLVPGDVDRALAAMTKGGAVQRTLDDFPEFTALPANDASEELMDKPLSKVALKKKARMRSKGTYKQVRRERG